MDKITDDLAAALRRFIAEAPIGDDDRPYCSDVMQAEFVALCNALAAYDAAKAAPAQDHAELVERLTEHANTLEKLNGDYTAKLLCDAAAALAAGQESSNG